MTDKEKYDFIDHVVHLTLLEEDRLLNEHGGEYSGLEEAGIDSNEYYRKITERVINILKKNNNYMQKEPVSKDYRERYKNIAQSDAFKSAYENKSLGEVISVEGEEPVSEDIEEVSKKYALNNTPYEDCTDEMSDAFKAGANWQKEQIEEALLSEVLPCFMHGGEADEVVAKLDKVLNQKK